MNFFNFLFGKRLNLFDLVSLTYIIYLFNTDAISGIVAFSLAVLSLMISVFGEKVNEQLHTAQRP